MSVVNSVVLKRLNVAWRARPFCDVAAKITPDLFTLDVATFARPFVAVPSEWQYLLPTSDIAANGWLPSTGSDLYAMLDEEMPNDSDDIYSPNNPTTQQFEVKLAPGVDPALSTGHTLRYRLRCTGLATNFDFDLVQGSTILDSWTDSITQDSPTEERSRTFSGAVANSITDYTDLRIRGVARA